MNAPAITLAQVLPAWVQAKEDERKAIAYRRELDQMVRSLLPTKDEGAVTADDGNYHVTVSYKLERKVDTSKLQADWLQIPAEAQAAFKWKADLSTTEFRKLSPELAQQLSQYITTKPASPAVSVDIKE